MAVKKRNGSGEARRQRERIVIWGLGGYGKSAVVILSKAKNVSARWTDIKRKILRFAQNDLSIRLRKMRAS